MIVKVIHKNLCSEARLELHNPTLIASVTIDKKMSNKAALEYAFEKTQNIQDSWSNPRRDGQPNLDGGDMVKVEAPLYEEDGELWGHRSSMMGDFFAIGQKMYVCEFRGFSQCEPVSYTVRGKRSDGEDYCYIVSNPLDDL